MQKADHSGHRSRMKKKLLSQGADVFEPHEILEILLYYAIPQKNTNDIAKNLIKHFGSLSAVLDASYEALEEAGLTEHQAILLKLIPDVSRIYLVDKHENRKKALSPEKVPAYILRRYIGLAEHEQVMLLLLDKKGKELFCGVVAQGDFDSVNLSFRKIVALAVNYSAVIAYLAHNHPSGMGLPSTRDVTTTVELKTLLKQVGVILADHFIIADGDCVSLAESGLI